MLKPALAALLLSAAPAAAGDVRVEVSGVSSTGGIVRVALCERDGYPKSCKRNRTMPAADAVSATFSDVPAGRYAALAFHDKNGDAKLNQGALGIPTEAYGFSRGGGRFGPPKFDDTAVDVPASGATVPVKLIAWRR
jgi:uncharacterized protein (DUF2141 family)